MPIFTKGNQSVLFTHVPKAGGTSIENLFQSSGWSTALLDRGRGENLNRFRRCSPQHMHADLLMERLRVEKFNLAFMIVREPISRFQSETAMRLPNLQAPWSPDASDFVHNVLRNYPSNPYMHDNHIRPQSEFYVPGSVVFKLEDGLQGIVDTLRNTYNLDLRDEIRHDTSRKSSVRTGDIEVPAPLKNRLVDLYREDYNRFSYALPETP